MPHAMGKTFQRGRGWSRRLPWREAVGSTGGDSGAVNRNEVGCPYRRRLDEMLAFRPSLAVPGMEVALFRRLQSFEVEARAAGASRETLAAIAAARFAVATDDLRSWIGLPRGH